MTDAPTNQMEQIHGNLMTKQTSLFTRKSITFFMLFIIISLWFMTDKSSPIKIQVSFLGECIPVSSIVTANEKHNHNTYHMISVKSGPAGVREYFLHYYFERDKYPYLQSELRFTDSEDDEIITEEDKKESGEQLHTQSLHAAFLAASRAAGKPVDYKKYFVFYGNGNSVQKYPLRKGDQILAIEGQPIISVRHIAEMIKNTNARQYTLDIKRTGSDFQITVSKDQMIIGLTYIQPIYECNLPLIKQNANLQGNSAGLITAITVYTQITGEPLAQGYRIAGTGAIDEEGNAIPISNEDLKAIAAHHANIDYMIVPDQSKFGDTKTNAERARRAIEERNWNKPEIIPVKSLDDAINFLRSLPPKDCY